MNGSRNPINVAILGAGDGGRLNWRALQRLEQRIVAVCDNNEDALRKATAELPGVKTYRSHAELFCGAPDLDLVVVATPDDAHLAPAQAAIQQSPDVHVFIEKPLATDFEDVKAFCVLLQSAPGRIHFSENQSFTYPVQQALGLKDELGPFLTGGTY